MKNLKNILLCLSVFATSWSIGQNISINTDGSTPDPSAMLDVADTTRGVLVPRLNITQRNGIVNPATGLLIFQTNSDSGFYYNSGTAAVPNWSKLLVDNEAITSISDIDGDTKIDVEQSADEDIIHFGTNGTEFFRIDSARFEILNALNNIFIGQNSGSVYSFSNGSSEPNLALGTSALELLTIGRKNVAIGFEALQNTTVGTDNTAVGQAAGRSNTDGVSNTAIGAYALTRNTTGTQNTAVGRFSLERLLSGDANTVIGEYSAPIMTSGNANTIIGQNALENNTGSSENTIIGVGAGRNNLTGGSNVFLGFLAGANELGSDKLYIENSNTTTPLIYGDFANDSVIVNGAFSIARNYTFPSVSPINIGDVLQYNGSNLVWAAGGGTPNLGTVLGVGKDAGGDSIFNLNALTIGSQRAPRASLEIDSVLTINGNINGLSLFGSNIYNDGSNIRYLNDGFADAYGIDVGMSGMFHWVTGTQGAILPGDPASYVRLEDSSVTIGGEPVNFEIKLKGIVTSDSLSINGLYSFPNIAPNVGEILRYNGTTLEWGALSGDNLGNHTATTNIELNGNYLSGDGDNEGIHVAANGNVTIGSDKGFDPFAVWNETGDAQITLNSEVSSTNISILARGNAGETNNITAFKSRGAWLSQTSVQAGDNIFTLNTQPFINGASTIYEAINISVDAANATTLSTRIDFATRVLSGTNARRLTIRGDGNVGIGTTSPSGKLEVFGDGSFIGGLRVSGTTSTTVGSSIYLDAATKDWTITATNASSGAGNNKLVFRDYTSAADRMTIDAAGNVGIGTTNPSSELEVVGDIEIPAANDYTYSTAKTHYQSFAPSTFRSTIPQSYAYRAVSGADFSGYFTGGSLLALGYATVQVNLPDGARVSELEGWIYDNLTTNVVRVSLYRQLLGSTTGGLVAQIESSVANASTTDQNLIDNIIFGGLIDNENYAYFLHFTGSQNSSETRLIGAKITYTVTETD